MKPGREIGPTAFDVFLIVISIPGAIVAAVLGGIIFFRPKPEDRPKRWLIAFAIAFVATTAFHFSMHPTGALFWVAPLVALAAFCRIILEIRAKRSREANAHNAEVFSLLVKADRKDP